MSPHFYLQDLLHRAPLIGVRLRPQAVLENVLPHASLEQRDLLDELVEISLDGILKTVLVFVLQWELKRGRHSAG